MGIPLEVTIGRLTGYPLHCQTDQPLFNPTPPATYWVCPRCKRELGQYPVNCDGHLVRVQSTECLDCGPVTPMRSAVRNTAPPVRSAGMEVCSHCGKPNDRHAITCERPRQTRAYAIDWSAA